MAEPSDRSILVGVFESSTDAQQAIAALRAAGFDHVRWRGPARGPASEGGSVRELLGLSDSEQLGREETAFLDGQSAAGRTLVVLDPGDRADEAWALLRQAGALGQDELEGATGTAAQDDQATQRLQLAEEELVVEKRPVQVGEVALRRNVVVDKRTIEVEVMREELVIERRQVDADQPSQAAAPAETDDPLVARFRSLQPGEVIRLPLMGERVEVRKQPVVYEEVLVGRDVVRENKAVQAPVRREVLRLERRGNVIVRSNQ
jgi:uncharacterized protein (TIGR02271 family)